MVSLLALGAGSGAIAAWSHLILFEPDAAQAKVLLPVASCFTLTVKVYVVPEGRAATEGRVIVVFAFNVIRRTFEVASVIEIAAPEFVYATAVCTTDCCSRVMPFTSSRVLGAVVPIPTLPEVKIVIAVVAVLICGVVPNAPFTLNLIPPIELSVESEKKSALSLPNIIVSFAKSVITI